MLSKDKNFNAFFELTRAGLWEKEACLSQFSKVDYGVIMRLAEEQSVVGLVTAGLEHVQDVKVPQEALLQFIGQSLQIEQRNLSMNAFIEDLYGKMQRNDLYGILIKGQGIAQCYERPLWRTAGDVDLLLNGNSYEKAKKWFRSFSLIDEEENVFKKRLNMKVDSWDVELHGTMRSELGGRIDRMIDKVQKDIFYSGSVRSWINGKTMVFLPSPNVDVIFVFTHILQHFFRGGIGLRQICDWCRLMWTYREKLDLRELERRLRHMSAMSEWRAFAAFAVEYLGMPVEAMPMYSLSKSHSRKARRILKYVMEVGNFGHNRDMSYKAEKPFLVRMMISLRYRTNDFMRQVMVFPKDAIRAYWYIWMTGLGVLLKWKR